MASRKSESGIVLIVCMIMLLMLAIIGAASLTTSNTEMEISGNEQNTTSAFYLADAGVARAYSILRNQTDWREGFDNQPLSDGYYSVVIVDSTAFPSLGSNVRVTSTGTYGEAKRGIEAIIGPRVVHPLYDYAIYAGNAWEYDPDADPQVWTAQLPLGGCGASADIVNGDIFFNGNVSLNCDAQVNGSVEAGGSISGNSPSEGAIDGADYMEPPDLGSMQYATISDFVIDNSSPWDTSGFIGSGDPRHVFVREFRSDLMNDSAFVFDNTNFFFGDPYEGADINNISISAAGNHSTYYVDGNLWIEPMGTFSTLINSPPGGTQITVVVNGNLYFSDDFFYEDPDLDGIAFVAMSDGESYTDLDGDNQYDPGEPILHDDGDGIYEGNMEGSGNVYFGDPNGGPMGQVSGFIYAENNFEDYVLDGPDGTPQTFGVNGLISAGNIFNVNRDFAGGHAEMTVNYDERLHNGTLSLPNLPRGNPTSNWAILAWREIGLQ